MVQPLKARRVTMDFFTKKRSLLGALGFYFLSLLVGTLFSMIAGAIVYPFVPYDSLLLSTYIPAFMVILLSTGLSLLVVKRKKLKYKLLFPIVTCLIGFTLFDKGAIIPFILPALLTLVSEQKGS